MKSIAKTIITVLALAVPLSAAKIENTSLKELCSVDYPARTQAGDMKGTLSVCALESALGRDASLYIVSSFEKEYPSGIDHILEHSIGPIIEKRGEEIAILYTSGTNSTCVAIYTIESGTAEFVKVEVIAWYDEGVYRKSEDFEKYESLLNKRDA
ncbi:hypothetical protein [Cerasicoccus frondis]|uniref:hypothetical protein n=1 Tax=Cerasicoccus frondis TaxID=490090 RepID=UPI002852B669|nr:hypothetical protein [Cerasicoccus frondis]